MIQIAWVAAGGALGAVARFGLGKAFQTLNPHPSFTAGTLIANVTGCFLLGLLAVALKEFEPPQREALIAFLLTGLLGGLTTFSSFILEFFTLNQTNDHKMSGIYLIAHIGLGLLALWGGQQIGLKWTASPH